jgi:hypothetical protein
VISRTRRLAAWTMFVLAGLTALLAGCAGLVLGPAQPAAASEADCAATYLADDGRELFTPAPETVPPPLRGFTWDCVSRLAIGSDDAEGQYRTYVFVFANTDVSLVVDILRSFERAGWIVGPSIGGIDYGPGSFVDGVALTADDLAALDTTPDYVRARFGDERTGQDIVELTYTDGSVYQSDVALTTPSIFLSFTSTRFFPAAGFADPSVLSSLRTIAEAVPSPTQAVVVCSASVILMLVVGYPASLLNSVVGSRYDQAVSWMRKVLRRPRAKGVDAEKPAADAKTGTSWLVWPGFVVAAIVAGFVDPGFGPNLLSLRMLLTGFLSFALFNLLGWAIVVRVVRRLQPDAKPYVKFRWGSLVILLVAVLIARLLDFSPGVIFGLVSGLAYAIALTSSRKAIVILVGSGYALLLSLLGWVGYSILAPLAEPGNAVLVPVVEFLSGVTLEGIATLPLVLLPLASLDGAELMKWKKWVWGIAYTVGLAAFALVLFTIPDSFATYTGDFLTWTLLFGAFAVVAVLAWWLDAVATKRASQRRHAGVPAAP